MISETPKDNCDLRLNTWLGLNSANTHAQAADGMTIRLYFDESGNSLVANLASTLLSPRVL
jgi:hypothetical protein